MQSIACGRGTVAFPAFGRGAVAFLRLGRGAVAFLLLACRTQADATCLSSFESAQAEVMNVEGEKLDSLDSSIAAVDAAIATCRSAGRTGEVEELEKARHKLSSHRDIVRRHEQMKSKRSEQSPEEIARLVQSGDSACPRGQAYLHKKSGKRVRCTGPQPAQMPWDAARSYFKRRGYKVREEDAAPKLSFVYGAERQEFEYDRKGSEQPASCITIYPPPDRSWQETTSRTTGVSPGRLKSGKPVRWGKASRQLQVDESPNKVIVRLGDCAAGG